jgi:RHS repeat-associated protein
VNCDPEDWSLAREFVWGPRFPEPIAMIDHTDFGDVPATGTTGGGGGGTGGGPEVLHYLHDVLGSTIALTDATMTAVERYTCDPYGRTVIEATDPNGLPTAVLPRSSYGNPFCWTGQRFDSSTQLYHFLFRSYSPAQGRWLQRDPMGYDWTLSLYCYGASDPVYWVDLFGLEVTVAGSATLRERIEKLIQKLCPSARVDKKTGRLSIAEAAPSNSPATSSAPATASAPCPPSGGASGGRGAGGGGGGGAGGSAAACSMLSTLINSDKRVTIAFGSPPGELSRLGQFRLDHGDPNHVNIWITNQSFGYWAHVNGKATWVKGELWQVLYDEVTHAFRWEQGRWVGDTDSQREEREQISETNPLFEDGGKEPRIPESHDWPAPKR